MKGEDCIRRKITIEGENYYLMIGKTFLQATVPRENAPQQSQIRNIVEQICDTVTEVQQSWIKPEPEPKGE
jgi:hypothetical protein